MRLLSTLLTALALKSSAAQCDVWSEVPTTSIVSSGQVFAPLSISNFTSDNPNNTVNQARIFFDVNSTSAPFVDMGCPVPLVAETTNSTYLACVGTDITASEFTEAAHNIVTRLSGATPLFSTSTGYGDYTTGECGTLPLGSSGTVFFVKRAALDKATSVDLAV